MDYLKRAFQGISRITSTARSPLVVQEKSPVEELVQSFRECCRLIDYFAGLENAESIEADRALHESKVREHVKKVISILQEESSIWIDEADELGLDVPSIFDDEDQLQTKLPCISAFLKRRMVYELCTRAQRDLPRGCMPFTLAIITSLLKNVKYPLLRHSAVYGPLNKLISKTASYDSVFCQLNNIKSDDYKKRLESNLLVLLLAMWRKISDDPALLDHFSFQIRPSSPKVGSPRSHSGSTPIQPTIAAQTPVATRQAGVASSSYALVRPQLDILTALIPLMRDENRGHSARESILVALAMKDYRIERFIVMETNLIDQVIGELCRKFFVAVDFCQTGQQNSSGNEKTVPSSSPFSLNGSVAQEPSKPRSILGSFKGPMKANEAKPSTQSTTSVNEPAPSNPIDSFIKILKFCNTMILVTSSKGYIREKVRKPSELDICVSNSSTVADTSIVFPGSPNPITPRFRRMYMSPESKKRANPDEDIDFRFELLQVYLDTFLTSAMLPALATPGEQHVIGAQIVVRKMLSELMLISSRGPLALTTARFILSNRDLLKTFITRAGSVSRSISVTTLQLFSSMLAAAPLEDAAALVLDGFEVKTCLDDDIKDFEAEVNQSFDDEFNSSHFSVHGLELSSDLQTPGQMSVHSISSPGATLDVNLAKICGVISASKLRISSPTSPTLSSVDDFTLFAPDDEYTESAAEGILARMAGRLSYLVAFVRSPERRLICGSPEFSISSMGATTPATPAGYPFDNSSNSSPLSTSVSLESRGPLMDLILLKLKGFLSLRFEEQLVVTGLIEKSICLLCSFMIISDGTTTREVGYLNLVIDIMTRVDDLWKEVLGHLKKIPDYSRKLAEFKRALAGTKSDLRKKKLLEKDASNVERILECAVIVRELLAEVRGHILAVRQLRQGLDEMSEGLFDVSGSIHLTKMNDSSTLICSDDEDEEEPDVLPDDNLYDPVPEIKEEDFLSEFESLERTLTDLISPQTFS